MRDRSLCTCLDCETRAHRNPNATIFIARWLVLKLDKRITLGGGVGEGNSCMVAMIAIQKTVLSSGMGSHISWPRASG